MALYHFSVRHVSRGKGQMVVASAAYISGQRIYDGYYNKIHDYTSKSGVVFTEILTPEYVPERMTDREILWNEVEHVERNNKAQLPYPVQRVWMCRLHLLPCSTARLTVWVSGS